LQYKAKANEVESQLRDHIVISYPFDQSD